MTDESRAYRTTPNRRHGRKSCGGPLIRASSAPYEGMKMTALDVQCPFCFAAPTEPCRNVRTPEPSGGGVGAAAWARPGTYLHIKRPHPERADAARRGQVRA